VDEIFDAFQAARVKPLVEIGFMPKALSIHPEPYRHDFPRVPVTDIYTGWAYPPKDYQKWSELVFQFVHHLRQRYGDAETKTWLWEVWNEPDIGYWQGTREEYFKLYDFTVDAVVRALPEARIGGPETTGPGNSKAQDFLRAFLEHCARQKNYANGRVGSRLDFISFHPKGSPTWQGDHVQMGISRQLVAIEQGFQITASFPEWRQTPIILGESDPEGCAACSSEGNPKNSYRNGALYGAYTVEVLSAILELARKEHVNFMGAVTWAFEFEDQPYFAGFRELATNGVDKPVLNAFRMLGLLGNERVKVTSSGALATEEIVRNGVRAQPDINAIASRKEREIEILIWNYHDDDVRNGRGAHRSGNNRLAQQRTTRSARTFSRRLGPQQRIQCVEGDELAAIRLCRRIQAPGECRPTAATDLTGMDRNSTRRRAAAIYTASPRSFSVASGVVTLRLGKLPSPRQFFAPVYGDH
jgi:xylan 1,4-beta-xylosidase